MKTAFAPLLLTLALVAQAAPFDVADPAGPAAPPAWPVEEAASSADFDAGASPPGPVATPREAAISVLKDSCPLKAERLLQVTAPDVMSDTGVMAGICECTAAALDATPPDVLIDDLPDVASKATIACARPPVTAHNQTLTREQFAGYLDQQGWRPEQIDGFSLCLAQGYWQGTIDGLQHSRAPRLKGSVLWADCATLVGETGTPMPTVHATTTTSTPPVSGPVASH